MQVLLSIPDAGARLGVSRSSVYNLMNCGALRTIKIGKRRLIPAAEIDRYVAGRMAELADVAA